MNRILFIENRSKTTQWSMVAEAFFNQGYSVHFLVQNHLYKLNLTEYHNHIIKYPNGLINEDLSCPLNIESLVKSLRAYRHFGVKSTKPLKYYANRIFHLIEDLKPNLVIGEATSVQELIAIEACKYFEIYYIHPSSCRYPPGRFSFYVYDTLEVISKGATIDNSQLRSLYHGIQNRSLRPTYMLNRTVKYSKTRYYISKFYLQLEYLKGERINTPSVITKLRLERRTKKILSRLSENFINYKDFKAIDFSVLYPMQMEPEANIDVWGKDAPSQFELIERITNCLGDREKLVIKLNPKAKYELTDNLATMIIDNPKIVVLDPNISMDTIWKDISCIVTITGTVAIEASLSSIPVGVCANLGHLMNPGMTLIKDNDALREYLENVRNENFITPFDGIEYLKALYNDSFEGNLGDDLEHSHHLKDENNQLKINRAFSWLAQKFITYE